MQELQVIHAAEPATIIDHRFPKVFELPLLVAARFVNPALRNVGIGEFDGGQIVLAAHLVDALLRIVKLALVDRGMNFPVTRKELLGHIGLFALVNEMQNRRFGLRLTRNITPAADRFRCCVVERFTATRSFDDGAEYGAVFKDSVSE